MREVSCCSYREAREREREKVCCVRQVSLAELCVTSVIVPVGATKVYLWVFFAVAKPKPSAN